MGRLIVVVVLVVLAVWLIRRALRGGRAPGPPRSNSPNVGELVRCAQCGLHLPRAEARAAGEQLYCSEEHARLGPRKP
jgi:uncharacterized protein